VVQEVNTADRGLEVLGRCGIISKIKILHLKIKVYMKNVAVFTH